MAKHGGGMAQQRMGTDVNRIALEWHPAGPHGNGIARRSKERLGQAEAKRPKESRDQVGAPRCTAVAKQGKVTQGNYKKGR